MFRHSTLCRIAWTAVLLLGVAAAPLAAQELEAVYLSAYGWVKPGEIYPFTVEYTAGPAGATSARIGVVLAASAEFDRASVPPSS